MRLLKGTKVDGVYDADPVKKVADAKRFERSDLHARCLSNDLKRDGSFRKPSRLARENNISRYWSSRSMKPGGFAEVITGGKAIYNCR